MNNINCDTNKIRSYSQNIINLSNEFYKLINKLFDKINTLDKKYLIDKFYTELCDFGKLYEISADIIEESILDNKYEQIRN